MAQCELPSLCHLEIIVLTYLLKRMLVGQHTVTAAAVIIFTARCTMHSAKRGLAITCRLSVRLSVCDIGDL